MPSKKPRCTCAGALKPIGHATSKAKSLFRGLLPGKSRPQPPKASTPCRACKTAMNRQGKVFTHKFVTDPLRTHPPNKIYVPLAEDTSRGRSRDSINRYIFGEDAGSDDEGEVLANRVYSMLMLEGSPVLDYFDRERGLPDLADLPRDVRRSFEMAIGAQF
ncbi:hypothetical protein F5Y10DRAFT_187664 [Nemania abortiva]|nr:hypothetical protein F5Y10DRAFT_187664 [Nemania abortiva]